jgi:hypothetical protein
MLYAVLAVLALLVISYSLYQWKQKSGGVVVVVRTGDEAPGAPGTQFHRPTSLALNSSGEVALKASLAGAGITSDNDEGIWLGHPGSLVLVAREGEDAPGTTGQRLGDTMYPREAPRLNDDSQIAFKAKLSPGGPVSQGIWVGAAGSLDLVTQSGADAPGTDAAVTFRLFEDVRLDGAAQVAFRASLDGPPVTGENDEGIWAGSPETLALVIREGPALTETQVSIVDSEYGRPAFDGLSLNADGRMMFRAQFPPTITDVTEPSGVSGVEVQYNYGLFMMPPISGGWLRVRPGDRARGTSDFEYLNKPGLNLTGNYAFAASYSAIHDEEDSGIWIDLQGTRFVVAVENDEPPGTQADVLYSDLSGVSVALNDQDEMAFRAGLRGPGVTASTDECIWAGTREALSLVACIGSDAVGAPGATFSTVSEPLLNNAGDVAFLATLTGNNVVGDNDTGIWATRQGNLSLVAREGDSYVVSPGLNRTVIQLETGFAFNDSGQVAFIARFSDDTYGLVLVTP